MEIAFKMLDKDGNGQLCKDEFFVVSPSLANLQVMSLSLGCYQESLKQVTNFERIIQCSLIYYLHL